MTELVLYVVAKGGIVLFGIAAGFVERVRHWSLPARAAVAYGTGAVALTLHATVLSAIAIPWTVATLALPLIALSGTALMLTLRWSPARRGSPVHPERPWFAWAITAAGLLHYALSVISLRSTSMDYLYFWGPKAVRFTAARGIDATLLADPFFMHLRPTYPLLVPVGYSWDSMLTGRMLWRLEMLDSAIWLAAAAVIVHAILAETYGPRARIGAAFWSVAISASAAASYSAGNAEAPLVFYVTIAAAALANADRGLEIIAAIMLAGSVLTKSEGRVLWIAIVAGAALAALVRRERRTARRFVPAVIVPAAALGVWYGYQLLHRLPLRDEMRQAVFSDLDFSRAGIVATTMFRFLGEGTWGLGWVVAIAVLLICRKSWREAILPAAASLSVMALYLVYYLHERRPLELVMFWEVPRISQPSLSLLILAAAQVHGREAVIAHDREQDASQPSDAELARSV